MKILKPTILEDIIHKKTINDLDQQDWNWSSVEIKNEKPANYYESSMEDWHTFDALDGDKVCEVVVIGGGLLGTSSALHLAEQGIDTVLLDRDRIGSGASGRNGGQLTPGLARWEAEEMIEHLGYDDAKKLWNFTSNEAMCLIDDIIEKYEINVERKHGHITAAVHEGHLTALTQSADARIYLGEKHTQIVGKHELYDYVKSDQYFGGIIDGLGGDLHPLALNRGLAYGFLKNGGKIYEQTGVERIEEKEDGIYVHTLTGVIKATKSVVIAVHHSSFKLLDENKQTTIPFYTYVATTKPLNISIKEILPYESPVYDTQLQIDYYRPVKQNRLLFGGQGTGTCWSSEKTYDYLLSRIHHVFPQLDDVAFDFVWSGKTDLTANGAADSRKYGDHRPIYAVHGWSGHGVAQTVRIGKAISDDLLELNQDFKLLTQVIHHNIPLGRVLAPMMIPMAKTYYEMDTLIHPGKMISF